MITWQQTAGHVRLVCDPLSFNIFMCFASTRQSDGCRCCFVLSVVKKIPGSFYFSEILYSTCEISVIMPFFIEIPILRRQRNRRTESKWLNLVKNGLHQNHTIKIKLKSIAENVGLTNAFFWCRAAV